VGGAADGGEVRIVWSNNFSIWSSKQIAVATGVKDA